MSNSTPYPLNLNDPDLEVQDPTDFPASTDAPGMRELDGSLRCRICGELYTAPMSLVCGHSFCSLCIRNYLTQKQDCPSCRHTASDVQLRKNITLEDAVRAWSTARSFVLELCKGLGKIEKTSGAASVTPRKRKRATTTDRSVESIGGRSQRTQYNERESDTSQVLAECPVCHQMVPSDSINEHLDGCLTSSSGGPSGLASKLKQKKDWADVFHAKEQGTSKKGKGKEKEKAEPKHDEPIPKVSYHTLKERKIREKLSEHGLPTNGDKDTLSARHQHWRNLFNANLDSPPTRRKSLEQLQKELREWEKSQRSGKTPAVTDTKAHQKIHKGQFDALVEAARPTKIRKVESERKDETQPHQSAIKDENIIDVDEASKS